MTSILARLRTFSKYTLPVLFTCAFLPLRAQTADTGSIPIAAVRTIHSTILGEQRKLYIHAPANMKTDESYPVLYLLDGEALIELVAGQITYLSESYKIIPQMIVVGIGNADRVRDFTPTHAAVGQDGRPDTSARAFGRNSGGGERFLRFMREELMPFVEKTYPAAPYRIIAGHSLGGLLALHCLATHPAYFNAYIAMSPSLQWDNDTVLHEIPAGLQHAGTEQRQLFFCSGSEDESFQKKQRQLDSTLTLLQVPGLRFRYQPYPEEAHTAMPVKAFYDGIRCIYPEWGLPLSNAAFRKTLTAGAVKQHYERLSGTYGYPVNPPQDELNAIARFLQNDPARIADAIELLQWNAAYHPNSVLIYQLLGDAYAKARDTARARSSYEDARCLAPGDKAIREKLQSLSSTSVRIN